jgi:hypothetical protein
VRSALPSTACGAPGLSELDADAAVDEDEVDDAGAEEEAAAAAAAADEATRRARSA